MEAGTKNPKASHEYFYTALRTIGCLALVFAFSWNAWPVGLVGVLAMATLASILVAYELSLRDVEIEWISAITGGILCFAGLSYLIWYLVRPPDPTGPLLAGNEASPRPSCSIGLGPNAKVFIATQSPPPGEIAPIGLAMTHGCPNLQLARMGQGLAVNATFYDRNSDIAFRLTGNVYESDTDLRVKLYRRNPHTLEIFDHLGREIFYFRYLNPNTVLVRASFFAR